MDIIDIVIYTILGRLTLDPAGMHCPSWDDAFVSSFPLTCCVALTIAYALPWDTVITGIGSPKTDRNEQVCAHLDLDLDLDV